MIYGYARCSTNESMQDINRQIRELKQQGAEEKTIYQAMTDHDLIMQDMSKRDKKKYMKLHNLK